MHGFGRNFGITLVAYLIGLAVAALAIFAIIGFDTISLDMGLPAAVMTTPMIAVVVFWGVARAAGANVQPISTFVLGGIAVYSLLYLCGRLVGTGMMSSSGATIIGAFALFLLCYRAISKADMAR